MLGKLLPQVRFDLDGYGVLDIINNRFIRPNIYFIRAFQYQRAVRSK